MTWRQETDYLRCNPSFHGVPRFDGVLVELGEGHVMFGKLLFVFACEIDTELQPFALILPLDAPIGVQLRKDKQLGLHRLRARNRSQSIFIPIRSIIRGALITDDPLVYNDYFLIDVVDTDWFLRSRRIFSDQA